MEDYDVIALRFIDLILEGKKIFSKGEGGHKIKRQVALVHALAAQEISTDTPIGPPVALHDSLMAMHRASHNIGYGTAQRTHQRAGEASNHANPQQANPTCMLVHDMPRPTSQLAC